MLVALLAGISAVASGGARTAAVAPTQSNGDWTVFGRTSEQNRHSPLTQITPSNVGDLGRIFKLDLRTIDPAIRRGQQSYPLAIGGVLYVTTNDNNVFAIDGTSGRVCWRYAPSNRAVFANFGIVANRGVAYCDGRLFLLTLDMHIVMLDPRTGRLLKRVPIESGVPGASINYGYSETSAPVCANGRLVLGAAGSEFGVRGFVMAFRTLESGAGLGQSLLDDPAGPPRMATSFSSRWRRRGLDSDDDRQDDEHAVLRHRIGDAPLLASAPPRAQPAY